MVYEPETKFTTVRIAFIFDRPTVNLRTSPGILTFEYPQGFTLLVELLQLLHIPQDPDDRASESIFMIFNSLKVLFIFFNCVIFFQGKHWPSRKFPTAWV